MAAVVTHSQGRFDLIVHGVLRSYSRWEDIPVVFDHVVRFQPDEQHADAALWDARLQELMELERDRRDQSRAHR